MLDYIVIIGSYKYLVYNVNPKRNSVLLQNGGTHQGLVYDSHKHIINSYIMS